ncbi:MAG: hypothetical protein IT329_09460 [Caldilineaceae bacterium]|nr:hypothetical protein [Caldilineaceae bacterium]
MKKQLPTAIANELAGSSVFFQKSTQPDSPQEPSPAESRQNEQSNDNATVIPRHHDTTRSRKNEGKIENKRPSEQEATSGDTTAATWETIRKSVKQIGKEAATHRFTTHEKNVLADIVYTYTRQGYRTSENEITRIAVNWLILDYQERRAQSVLARMLEVLHK